ncbi:MAG: hypothetical protein ACI9BD_000658 [Candidatus Marinamargulisbacteria bacterium]|jgi:hypothetical protein
MHQTTLSASSTIELQSLVSRRDSVKVAISGRADGWGIGSLFSERVPFNNITALDIAVRLAEVVSHLSKKREQKEPLHVFEFGVGCGVLANHLLNTLRDMYPDLYKRVVLHVSDISQEKLTDLRELNVFESHLDRVEFDVIDLRDPTFKASPLLIYHTYLFDALPARHIGVENGALYELQVQTHLKGSAVAWDTTEFPPIRLDAEALQNIYSGVQSIPDEKFRLVDRQVAPQLQESFARVPLDEADIPAFEKQNIKNLVAGETLDNVVFNFSQELIHTTLEIIDKMPRESCYLGIDFFNAHAPSSKRAEAAMGKLVTNFGVFNYFQVTPEIFMAVAKSFRAPKDDGATLQYRVFPNIIKSHNMFAFVRTSDVARYNFMMDRVFVHARHADYDLAISLIRTTQDPDELITVFDKLSAIEQQNYCVCLAMGRRYLELDSPAKAKTYALKSLNYGSHITARSLCLLSDIGFYEADYQDALDYAKKAHGIAPQMADVQACLYREFVRTGDLSALKTVCREMVLYATDCNLSIQMVECLKVEHLLGDETQCEKIIYWIKNQAFWVPDCS